MDFRKTISERVDRIKSAQCSSERRTLNNGSEHSHSVQGMMLFDQLSNYKFLQDAKLDLRRDSFVMECCESLLHKKTSSIKRPSDNLFAFNNGIEL